MLQTIRILWSLLFVSRTHLGGRAVRLILIEWCDCNAISKKRVALFTEPSRKIENRLVTDYVAGAGKDVREGK
jgi:hypothetical protein